MDKKCNHPKGVVAAIVAKLWCCLNLVYQIIVIPPKKTTPLKRVNVEQKSIKGKRVIASKKTTCRKRVKACKKINISKRVDYLKKLMNDKRVKNTKMLCYDEGGFLNRRK